LYKTQKKRGLKVFVYTVDEPEDILMMKALEVDGIFANFPARARRLCLKNKDSG
jgi:glycerophosphoryl diester phosphodiesterase